jgi:beta-ribofuranosylaminobenzene 5'-phosphate synthase
MLPDGNRRSGQSEVRFFNRNTPIPSDEVKEVLSLVYHGLVPAVLTEDLILLSRALKAIHKVGFKRRELDGQSLPTQDLLSRLQAIQGCASGMSSMGPLVYAITREAGRAVDQVRSVASETSVTLVGVASGSNSGYRILGQ